MEELGALVTGCLLICVFFLAITGLLYVSGGVKTYKDGQVDAINGKIMFEKVIHSDQTVTWEEIPAKDGKE